MTDFRTRIGLRGRLGIPEDIQAKAQIAVGDEVHIRCDEPGIIILESSDSVRRRAQKQDDS